MSELRDATQDGVEDATLLERMTAGDEQALSELFDRYAPLVSSFATAMVGSSDEADEVVYDVFLQSWNHAGEYRREHGKVAAWLIQFARKRIAGSLHSREERGMQTERSGLDLFTPGTATSGTASSATTAPSLSDLAVTAMQNLDQRTREILLFASFKGLGESEVAERFRLSIEVVRAVMSDGLSSVRRSLGERL